MIVALLASESRATMLPVSPTRAFGQCATGNNGSGFIGSRLFRVAGNPWTGASRELIHSAFSIHDSVL